MRYEFRTSTGAICCSAENPDYLCAKCKTRRRTAGGETTIPSPYGSVSRSAAALVRDEHGVPDAYAAARSATNVIATNGIPDGYATALARRKGA
jgi:hypothetical protein